MGRESSMGLSRSRDIII